MPSLLQKLSYFDPETGNTFIVASDGFYWKEGKKSPEDSKVTKLVGRYGWKLQHGTDAFLIFKKKGDSSNLFVVRGSKKWFYELRNSEGDLYRVGMKGKGLDSLHDALEGNLLKPSLAMAASAAVAVNSAGSGHEEVEGELRPDARFGSALLQKNAIHPDYGTGFSAVMNELNDEGGLGRRPDYGESKGACLVLSGAVKTATGTEPADMYVTSVGYSKGNGLKLAGFHFSPNPAEAKVFLPRTAANLARQIRAFCGQTAKIAKPGDLITTQNVKTQKKPRKELLTKHNLKTQKGESKGFLTGIMHMMPSDLAGYGNVCPCASPECRQMCLNTAGTWSNSPHTQNSRRMKTELYFKNRPQFMADMRKSIEALIRKAEKNGLTPAIRINGTSDLPQVSMEMAREYPDVQFYDYTKIPQPWKRQLPNYHITFSRSEINDKDTMEALEHGVNVAVVFGTEKGAPLPKEWRGYKVIDGDEHDLRFLDSLEGDGPFVIGLRGKGKARGENKRTESGFVVDPKSLVQISPLLQKKGPKKDLVQIDQPMSTNDRIKERSRPATQPEDEEFWKEEEVMTASSGRKAPHNEWFVEGCFDDAHLYV